MAIYDMQQGINQTINFLIINQVICMIVRQTLRILHSFGRLVKPRLSNYENIFDIMKDRTSQLRSIEDFNNKLLTRNKNTRFTQILADMLDVSEKTSEEVAKTTIKSIAYSPITNTPYHISQNLDGEVKVLDNVSNLESPYQPGHNHLKFHYSITSDVPNLQEYVITKSSAYIFNLPQNVTEKQLLMELGLRLIKHIKIHYCMLGLPAYAEVEFISENHLTEKIISNKLDVSLEGKTCKIVTQADAHTLPLNRRQIVIKQISPSQTPAKMLTTLSKFGRVMNLNFPMDIYKQPSIESIKELYKNQKYPIKINYYRKNGTIQSEFYPPFEPKDIQKDFVQQKQEQYKRRLRYCQNVNVYQGKQFQVTTAAKGFCIVTFSCQEQAQNCYLQLGLSHKIQLLNGRQQFQFDQKHRQALLRFIDNSYIDKCLESGPTKNSDLIQEKRNSSIYKSIYLSLVFDHFKNVKTSIYRESALGQSDERPDIQLHYNYRTFLNQMKQTIGKGNYSRTDDLSEGNLYGKSFDELAQEQLYGQKLKQRSLQPRYEVDVDNFIQQSLNTSIIQPNKSKFKNLRILRDEQEIEKQFMNQAVLQGQKYVQTNEEQAARVAKQQQKQQQFMKQKTQKIKKSFSTVQKQVKQYRPKTLKQKVRSHMNYNRFVRDTINQYMGIFPIEKLQSQFNRKKPTFINPQNLKFVDGSDFLKQTDLANVLLFANNQGQKIYDSTVKANQIFKSLNLDVQETILKNIQDTDSEVLYHYSDIGVIKEEFDFQGSDVQEKVKKLNVEAQFGEQFRVVKDEESGNNKIVKIAKFQSILPLQLVSKCEADLKKIQQQGVITQKDIQIAKKYEEYFFNGQPIPDQLAKILDKKPGEIIDAQKMLQQICATYNVTKKDLQKMMNIGNYSKEQIQEDIQRQLLMGKAREKRSSRKASDYSKDASQIKARDKSGKAVVSKFRQM